jgi:hypothetical protein
MLCHIDMVENCSHILLKRLHDRSENKKASLQFAEGLKSEYVV